jgi:hypothetical protein
MVTAVWVFGSNPYITRYISAIDLEGKGILLDSKHLAYASTEYYSPLIIQRGSQDFIITDRSTSWDSRRRLSEITELGGHLVRVPSSPYFLTLGILSLISIEQCTLQA